MEHPPSQTSRMSSPRLSAVVLPSPPSSPHLHPFVPSVPGSPSSMFSFPSGPSSLFSLSVASSPPHPPITFSENTESLNTLIIPSLTLSQSSGHATVYGETIGNLTLLVMGRNGAGKSALATNLLDANDDVLDVGVWTDGVLSASSIPCTDSSRSRNIKIVEVPGFDEEDGESNKILEPVLEFIHGPFCQILEMINPTCPSSEQLLDLVACTHTPLYTALVFLLSSPPTNIEIELLNCLSPHIPIIPLPTCKSLSMQGLSTFRPRNTLQLREGLFRDPQTLQRLRREAGERFLWWREVHAAALNRELDPTHILPKVSWDWELHLSKDIAETKDEQIHDAEDSVYDHYLDPLHLPSLFLLSLSLLSPLRKRLFSPLNSTPQPEEPSTFSRLKNWGIGMVFTLGCCAGLGFGILYNAILA